ncbi:hypothetical protein H7F33_02820 [Pedobacter sp. PAMC26386]|nr:hypothetical protein H7F33_02820 [Pedobacter sp. PAMC26386]
MINFSSWNEEEIRSIQVPVLVSIGDQDVVRPEAAVELYRLLPKGRLAIFSGGHGECLGKIMTVGPGTKGKADFFVTMIREFLG